LTRKAYFHSINFISGSSTSEKLTFQKNNIMVKTDMSPLVLAEHRPSSTGPPADTNCSYLDHKASIKSNVSAISSGPNTFLDWIGSICINSQAKVGYLLSDKIIEFVNKSRSNHDARSDITTDKEIANHISTWTVTTTKHATANYMKYFAGVDMMPKTPSVSNTLNGNLFEKESDFQNSHKKCFAKFDPITPNYFAELANAVIQVGIWSCLSHKCHTGIIDFFGTLLSRHDNVHTQKGTKTSLSTQLHLASRWIICYVRCTNATLSLSVRDLIDALPKAVDSVTTIVAASCITEEIVSRTTIHYGTLGIDPAPFFTKPFKSTHLATQDFLWYISTKYLQWAFRTPSDTQRKRLIQESLSCIDSSLSSVMASMYRQSSKIVFLMTYEFLPTLHDYHNKNGSSGGGDDPNDKDAAQTHHQPFSAMTRELTHMQSFLLNQKDLSHSTDEESIRRTFQRKHGIKLVPLEYVWTMVISLVVNRLCFLDNDPNQTSTDFDHQVLTWIKSTIKSTPRNQGWSSKQIISGFTTTVSALLEESCSNPSLLLIYLTTIINDARKCDGILDIDRFQFYMKGLSKSQSDPAELATPVRKNSRKRDIDTTKEQTDQAPHARKKHRNCNMDTASANTQKVETKRETTRMHPYSPQFKPRSRKVTKTGDKVTKKTKGERRAQYGRNVTRLGGAKHLS
jgi:hypothetical protein